MRTMTIEEFWREYQEEGAGDVPYVSEARDFLSDLNAVIRHYGGRPTPVNETIKQLVKQGEVARDGCTNMR